MGIWETESQVLASLRYSNEQKKGKDGLDIEGPGLEQLHIGIWYICAQLGQSFSHCRDPGDWCVIYF